MYTVSTTVSHAPVAPVSSQSRFCCEPFPLSGLDSQQDFVNPVTPSTAVNLRQSPDVILPLDG